MGLDPIHLEPYGRNVAKVELSALHAPMTKRAAYVLVSAITPTPLGEGKTTTTVGLGQAMGRLGVKAVVTLRQPSLGPTFGIKGGAAGGGFSQVIPMERLNLHLTGDFHAVTAAHNLLAATLDNHLFQGNALDIDLATITWRRVLDVNDRSLRTITIGQGDDQDGVERPSGFDITAASEVMAILALARDLADLRYRLGRIVVGYSTSGQAITAEMLQCAGAMAVLLLDALKPNLLQTLEGTPAIIHAGPFGNIATGNSSVIADLIASRTADVVITEAGFGADMGAERFFNIKCRASGLTPDAGVVVATVRALKAHSGNYRIVAGKPLPPEILEESPDDVRSGAANLAAHLRIMNLHGVQPVVAINAFPGDHDSEHEAIAAIAAEHGAEAIVATHFQDGGAGAVALAEAVLRAVDRGASFTMLYPDHLPIAEKLERIATEVYGADGIDLSPAAAAQLELLEANGLGDLSVCVAKTHLSISSDPKLLGAPTGWRLPVREIRTSAGAGFAYAICGTMRTMPGLGKHPASERIDVTEDGTIVGLS
jgi:formate--tetrahydrofolate ligase